MGVFLGMLNTNSLLITPELLNLSAEIDEFKGSWKTLGTTGANRNTVKLHFRRLVENNFLELVGKGRGAWYKLL